MKIVRVVTLLAALVWWACYFTRDHAVLELIAALGNTFAWALLMIRPSKRAAR